MPNELRRRSTTLGMLFALISVSAVHTGQSTPSTASELLTQRLPALNGTDLRARLFEVTYQPGGANVAHTHPCAVMGYVLEGAIRMGLQGQPERVVRVGESFYEGPGDRHLVSANASATERARFLAYFLCDRDVAQLSVPIRPEGR